MSSLVEKPGTRASLVIALAGTSLACGLILSRADQGKLAAACEGQAVEGAGAYDGGPKGFAPFKKDEAGGAFEYDVNGVNFKLARPRDLAGTHTVFCMEPAEEVDGGLCAFETVEGVGVAGVQVIDISRSKGPTFARVNLRRTGRLVDPSTGETVAEHTVIAEAPRCEDFVGEPTQAAFRALTPSGISFGDWALEQLGVSK